MINKKRTYKGEIPSRDKVVTYPEYWKFIHWCATPTPLREPKSETEFAKAISVHRTTLSRWQSVDGFMQDVHREIKKMLGRDVADVYYAVRQKVYKDGSASEAKILLQELVNFAEKSVVEQSTKIDPDDPDVKKAVKEFEEKLKASILKKGNEHK